MKRFSNNDDARASFAIVAVVILISATISAAYFYSLNKEGKRTVNVPSGEFGAVQDAVILELVGISRSSLENGLSVYSNALVNATFGGLKKDLDYEYMSFCDGLFKNMVAANFNGTRTEGNIDLTVTVTTRSDAAFNIIPIYQLVEAPTEKDIGQVQMVATGFVMNNSVDITMVDRSSLAIAGYSTNILANISTNFPLVIHMINSMDYSSIDRVLSAMVQSVVFARTFGSNGELITPAVSQIPKPGEEWKNNTVDESNGFVTGFRSDKGPVKGEELFSVSDLGILSDLALILFQVRFFGTWDDTFISKFVAKINDYSTTLEGKMFKASDLKILIGTSRPNFVNCEALTLELFHRMGRIESTVDIVLPQYRKMLDIGFMSGFNDETTGWISDLIDVSSPEISALFDIDGWVNPDFPLESLYLHESYQKIEIQFLAMVLSYILRSYHLDHPEEIKQYVNAFIGTALKDGLLKDVPDTVKVPPGSSFGLEFSPKDFVEKGLDKALETGLKSMHETDMTGIELNGYTLVYLFINFFDRPEVDRALYEACLQSIYDNWTELIIAHLSTFNLTSLNYTVQNNYTEFSSYCIRYFANLTQLMKTDVSMNQTMNSSLNKVIATMNAINSSLEKASYDMEDAPRFFVYGQDAQTVHWTELDTIRASLDTAAVTLEEDIQSFVDLLSINNETSPEHDACLMAESLMNFIQGYLDLARGVIKDQLITKWKRDTIIAIFEQMDKVEGTTSRGGTIYEIVGLLSEKIPPHPWLGFNHTIEDLSEELANLSAWAKGLTFMENNTKVKFSFEDIFKDDRGLIGLFNLLKKNIDDIRHDFLDELEPYTKKKLVNDNSNWANHKTYELANGRLLFSCYNESLSELELRMQVIKNEISSYTDISPLELYNNNGNLYAYGELSYLLLKEFVLDSLLMKIKDLEITFAETEFQPGFMTTFGGITRKDASSNLILTGFSFNYSSYSASVKFSGQRIFENTSANASENLFEEYLNPFSKEWHDYYITTIRSELRVRPIILLRFNETKGPGASFNNLTQKAEVTIDLQSTWANNVPSPLPVVNILYKPVSPFYQTLRTVELERNIFSKTWNKANVNFTYRKTSYDWKDRIFRVQVTALVRSYISTMGIGTGGIETLVDLLVEGRPDNYRDLTSVIEVRDNDDKDQNKDECTISLNLSLDLEKLKIGNGLVTFYDPNPLLYVQVWTEADMRVIISQTLLGSSVGNKHLFSYSPSILVVEQGYFTFTDTNDPVLGAYDVGEGENEVNVPQDIANEDLIDIYGIYNDPIWFVDTPLMHLEKFDDPSIWKNYGLTCRFKPVRNIPSDSIVIVNNGIPLLVDFDGGHQYLRDEHLGLAMLQSSLTIYEESLLNSIAPKKSMDSMYFQSLPPSEYKFALTYNFMPVYIQYYLGPRPQTTLTDFFNGKDFILTYDGQKDFELANIPYRVVPLNIERGMVALSIWVDLLKSLSQENYTLDFYVYDIINNIVREYEDTISMISSILPKSGDLSVSLKLFNTTTKSLKNLLGFYKAVSSILKTYKKELNMGRLRISIPGSKDGLDQGANFYLGFDVAQQSSLRNISDSNIEITQKILTIALWTDFKACVKVFKEFVEIYDKNIAAGKKFYMNILEKQQKFIDWKNYNGYFDLANKYYKLSKTTPGKSAKDFGPAPLFRIMDRYKMTKEQMIENGDLSRQIDYSIVDVSLLRHRNNFTLAQISELRTDWNYSKAEAHGLTCINDISYNKMEYFSDLINLTDIPISDTCLYGSQTLAQWDDIKVANRMGVPNSAMKDAAKIGLPLSVLVRFVDHQMTVDRIVRSAKNISKVPGVKGLYENLVENFQKIIVIDAVDQLKKSEGLFVMPLGLDGPDVFLDQIVVFGMTMDSKDLNLENKFLEKHLPSILKKATKQTWVYIDLRFSAFGTSKKFMKALKTEVAKLDHDAVIQQYVMVSETSTATAKRTGDSVIEI